MIVMNWKSERQIKKKTIRKYNVKQIKERKKQTNKETKKERNKKERKKEKCPGIYQRKYSLRENINIEIKKW